jgi:hypothetical protein
MSTSAANGIVVGSVLDLGIWNATIVAHLTYHSELWTSLGVVNGFVLGFVVLMAIVWRVMS